MKITDYNPSIIEVDICEAIGKIIPHLESHLNGMKVSSFTSNSEAENPKITLHLVDSDEDPHEVVLSIIQRPDK